MDRETRTRLHEAIVQLADGDRTRFPDVFAALWQRVLRFVRRALGESPDADDIAQRVLINVFFRIAEFDPSRDGVTWVFGIAAWEVRTHLKQRQRRRETSASEITREPEAGAASPEALAIQRDLEAALQEALGALTPADQAALTVPPADASGGRSGPASPAARKRRQRALARLRSVWSQRYD